MKISQRDRHRLKLEQQALYRAANVYPANSEVNNLGVPWVDCLIETPVRLWHLVLHEREQKYRTLGRVPPTPLFVNGEEVDVEFYLKKLP